MVTELTVAFLFLLMCCCYISLSPSIKRDAIEWFLYSTSSRNKSRSHLFCDVFIIISRKLISPTSCLRQLFVARHRIRKRMIHQAVCIFSMQTKEGNVRRSIVNALKKPFGCERHPLSKP
ncbi:hypothetical protein BC829DRAFT_147189 [Chytridium lagenaria]|nr:hypothetical protein BC829DRAFT_147189 [Chytridium lagenaria]